MAHLNAYIANAIAQLFDDIEDKCKGKFATFTASDVQGNNSDPTKPRTYMSDTPNNMSHGIYKYLYDPQLSFDYRFHQRLAAAPFVKTKKPWATIMFNTKQAHPLTNVLSHKYPTLIYHNGKPYKFFFKRVSVPINMAIVSNDMTKLYDTTEKIAMYFDRFINFHYDHVIEVGDITKDGFEIIDNVAGCAHDIREVDLAKFDTEQRGSLVSETYSFNLVYWVVDAPNIALRLLKKIILEVAIDKPENIIYRVITTEDGTFVE